MSARDSLPEPVASVWNRIAPTLPGFVRNTIRRMGLPRSADSMTDEERSRLTAMPTTKGTVAHASFNRVRCALANDADLVAFIIAAIEIAVRYGATRGAVPAEPSEAKRWIYATARNTAHAFATKEGRHVIRYAESTTDQALVEQVPDEFDMEQVLDDRRDLETMRVLVAELPEAEQRLLWAAANDDYEVFEAESGVKRETLRVQVCRLRKTLRRRLIAARPLRRVRRT